MLELEYRRCDPRTSQSSLIAERNGNTCTSVSSQKSSSLIPWKYLALELNYLGSQSNGKVGTWTLPTEKQIFCLETTLCPYSRKKTGSPPNRQTVALDFGSFAFRCCVSLGPTVKGKIDFEESFSNSCKIWTRTKAQDTESEWIPEREPQEKKRSGG